MGNDYLVGEISDESENNYGRQAIYFDGTATIHRANILCQSWRVYGSRHIATWISINVITKTSFFIINNVYFAESIKTKFFISIRRYKGGMIRDFPSHIGFLFFMTLLNAVQGKQISRNDIGRLVWLVVKLKRWINHLNSHRRQTTNVVAGMLNRFYLETSDLYVKQQHRRRGFLNSINSSSWTLKNSFDFVLTSFVIRNGLNIAS